MKFGLMSITIAALPPDVPGRLGLSASNIIYLIGEAPPRPFGGVARKMKLQLHGKPKAFRTSEGIPLPY